VKLSKLGDRTLFEGVHDGKSVYSTFVDGTTLVGSTSKDVLASAVEGKGTKNKELSAVMSKLDAKQSLLVAARVPEEGRKFVGGLNQGQADALEKLKRVGSSVNIPGGVAAGVRLSTGNEKAAKDIAEFGDMAKGLLAAAAAVNKDLVPLAEELQKTLNVKATEGD